MQELLINNWGWGIGDDENLRQNWEFFDCQWIDISSPRVVRANWALETTWTSFTSSGSVYMATESNWRKIVSIQWWTWATISGTTIGYGSTRHITLGSDDVTYNETTAPAWQRHLFFPISDDLVYANYNGSSIATIALTAWNSKPCTAICYLQKGALIYAKGNKIFEINPATTTPTNNGLKVELPIGVTVRHIYYYNGLIWFVYTFEDDTYIQGCEYTGGSTAQYSLRSYNVKIAWHECIGALWDSGYIYWLSANMIHIFDWVKSTPVRRLMDSVNGSSNIFFNPVGDVPMAFNQGILWIGSNYNLWFYGAKKPWYKKALTKIVSDYQIYAITNTGLIIGRNWTTYRYDSVSTNYRTQNYIVTHPYFGNGLQQDKDKLGIRLWFSFEEVWIQSIVVKVTTDEIYRQSNNTDLYADYVTVATLTSSEFGSKRNININPQVISKALWNAGYTDIFGWMKVYIEMNGTATSSPEIWDLLIYNDVING